MSSESFFDGRVRLECGDMREALQGLEPDSVDSCVCDPPYHLASIVKRFGKAGSAPVKVGDIHASNDIKAAFARQSRGFMGKEWDGGEIAFEPETWSAVYRVLKPGGHLLAFGAPKNFGFMQYAIAQAGFEVRDVIAWLFGSGFPKSHNIGDGWGTALKPAYEPIIMARKPLVGTVAQNVAEHGTGAINVDACRVATTDSLGGGGEKADTSAKFTNDGWKRPWMENAEHLERQAAKVRANVEKAEALGRWPANVVTDGSDEVLAAFPESSSGALTAAQQVNGGFKGAKSCYGTAERGGTNEYAANSGSAARFFYTAKADSDDRLGSKHPTVKPVDLMQWLVRLVTPKGGLVLDPFAGTGTTGEAAFREGMRAILIEREPEYQNDIRRRMELILAGPTKRRHESLKARGLVEDAGPLFGGDAA